MFSNGLDLAYLSVQHFFSQPSEGLLRPGRRMAEALSFVAEQISLRMEPKDVDYAGRSGSPSEGPEAAEMIWQPMRKTGHLFTVKR
jgi:hypothetical protein